jgi:oxygen-dependent protoporphyrinogen oxidase
MGGVHAGRSELLSTAVAAPQLLAAGRKGRSLMASLPEAPPSTDPVFLTVASGLGEVIDAAAKQIPDIRCDTPIDELRVVGAGWEILGEAFEGVIVATHAPVTARLVADAAPDAADALRSVEYASVVLTLLAYPTAEMREPFRLSGFLVPRPEKKLLSAISWSSAKWAHHAGRGIEIVRASTGRIDDRRHEDMDDGALVAALHDEIAQATGVGSAAPTYARVNRWPSALPQFRVGHLTKVAARAHASAATAPAPLALAGSAYEGLGLPACVASGRAAARAVSVRLGI